ncbi:formate dehydrogenase accessory protein FdhE [Bartonella sp. HY406]|uniref:formate dehydrogenase accessory protein FdhE n=1 Tax=Bartonella sp. HY406 TaxID=2979331 RepID=UPI0021CA706C|nr:formate dehydrogenase accessory protein FdhE [Bartonella sp. HY406]UXN03102.1 formate dehydrogenase accessory protein FdhE [Bartonella sp. HY406]
MPRDKKFEGDMTAVGTMREPPVCRVANIDRLFEDRALRFERLAPTNPVSSYIQFLTNLTKAQHETAQKFKDGFTSLTDEKSQISFGMPIIDRTALYRNPLANKITKDLFARIEKITMPEASMKALAAVKKSKMMQKEIAENLNDRKLQEDQLPEHIFMLASLQVLYSLAASQIDASNIKPLEQNLCPACGGTHSASQIVNWPNAEGTRFCSCLYCGTMWNYVRIKCTFCGETGAVEYGEVADGPGSILVESCRDCGKYCKMTDAQKDVNLDVFADDIGSLALDLLVKQEGRFVRGAFNPFLYGF